MEMISCKDATKKVNEAGGDWWHYESSEEGEKIRFFLGDVTGHGEGAAMVTSILAGIRQGINYQESLNLDSQATFKALSEGLYKICGGQFLVSGCALEIDSMRVRYLMAGAPPIYLFKETGEVELLQSSGTMLGGERLEIGIGEISVSAGDVLFAMTDGLIELKMRNGNSLGYRRLEKMLKSLVHEDAQSIRNMLLEEIAKVDGEGEHSDDRTFIVLKFAPNNNLLDGEESETRVREEPKKVS